MQTINIEGKEITYFKQNELSNADLDDETRSAYEKIYKLADFISKQLKVQCPDIGLSCLIRYTDRMGGVNIAGAKTYTPKDISSLKNNFILMSYENFNPLQFSGTLAHEMRHIWQDTYNPEINEIHANGFEESLTHPAEIDADGYAIWYLSKTPNMSIEKAAEIICPEEKKYYPKEYICRIERAKEIKALFEENQVKTNVEITEETNVGGKQDKNFFFKRIKTLFNFAKTIDV